MQASKRGQVKTGQKEWLRPLFLIVIWILIVSMVRDFLQTKRGFLRVEETEERLKKVKEENETLLKKLTLVSLPEHKERLIREKLNMQRGDEVIAVLPKDAQKIIRQENTQKIHTNWGKWMDVFGISMN